MADEASKTCVECEGVMSPVVVTDRYHQLGTSQVLEYHQSGDSRSFWTGKFPTAGQVRAFMCGSCGRIALYGEVPDET